MIENFQQHNISTEFVLKCPDVMTGTAAIIVTRKGDNNIVYVPGATNSLTPEEINKLSDSLFKDCRLFVSTFECTPESLHAALLLARKHKGNAMQNLIFNKFILIIFFIIV